MIDIARYNLGGPRSILPDTILGGGDKIDSTRHNLHGLRISRSILPMQSCWVKNLNIDFTRYNLGVPRSIMSDTILLG